VRTSISTGSLLWLLPLAAVVGCSKPESKAASTPAAAAPAPPPPPSPVTAKLETENRSRVTGEAVLTPKGDSTEIALTLHGGRANTTYPSHVHFGTCKKPGAVVVPLKSVKVGRNRSGTSTTTVLTATLDSASAAHGTLLVQSHLRNGKPAACGEVPGK